MTKILLVEDTPALAAEIADILRMEEFDVTLVTSGFDALIHLRAQLTDIVISDLFMPRIDGFQLISAIKNDSRLKQIPIIILSARTTPDAIDKVKSLGGDLFIQKPCDGQYLVMSIKKVLNQKEQIHAND
jgi:DNA-binding response OmpR family regulator